MDEQSDAHELRVVLEMVQRSYLRTSQSSVKSSEHLSVVRGMDRWKGSSVAAGAAQKIKGAMGNEQFFSAAMGEQ